MKPKKAPTLTHRVGALERRMTGAEDRLEALAHLPEQVREIDAMLRASCDQHRNEIDHVEATVIDQEERTRETMARQLTALRDELRDQIRAIPGCVQRSE